VLGVAAATVLVVRQGLADHERDDARHSLRSDPGAALASARRSLDFDPSSVDSRWLEGAALARFGEADAAEASLRRAARQEPENFVAWTLIGDLATRRGERAAAHAAYLRARSLNPRDPDVRLAVRRSAR
jgi:cytochrome c-type biogenesis protein CcmH/NrfG